MGNQEDESTESLESSKNTSRLPNETGPSDDSTDLEKSSLEGTPRLPAINQRGIPTTEVHSPMKEADSEGEEPPCISPVSTPRLRHRSQMISGMAAPDDNALLRGSMTNKCATDRNVISFYLQSNQSGSDITFSLGFFHLGTESEAGADSQLLLNMLFSRISRYGS